MSDAVLQSVLLVGVKMADDTLVLSNPLCFLSCRFGKSAVKHLKSALLDFYSVEDLADTKKLLISDVNRLSLSSLLPHVPDRRESELRAAHIVNDIVMIITVLDENNKLKLLPKYVADSPDSMPSTRLYDSDLCTLMRKLENIDRHVVEIAPELSAIGSDVKVLQSKINSTGATSLLENDSRSTNQSRDAGRIQVVSGPSSVNNNNDVLRSAASVSLPSSFTNLTELQPGAVWSSVAASSPIVPSSNRFSALMTTDEERDPEPFTEYRSRRSIKRHRRSTPQSDQPRQSQPSAL